MVMVNIYKEMALYIEECGKMINKKVKVQKYGKIKQDMKVILKKDKNMESENWYFKMVQILKVNLNSISLMEKVNLIGQMAKNMMENG